VTAIRESFDLQLRWLERLRWASIIAQAVVVAGVQLWLNLHLPVLWVSLLLSLGVLVNLGSIEARRRQRPLGAVHIAVFLALDLLLFTGVLYLTGGTSNPFSCLYLVYIAVAALVLPPSFSAAIVALSLGCFAALFLGHVSLPFEDLHHHEEFGWYQRGTWLALAAAASLTAFLMSRVLRELRQREVELDQVRRESARREKLASLATLAAGAAHELGSPLSTIAVAARELQEALSRREGLDTEAADAGLIRAQVDRCRAVLEQLAHDAGQSPGTSIARVSLADLVEQACTGLESGGRLRIEVPREHSVRLPVKSVARALRGVIRNAIDASSPKEVTIDCELRDEVLRLTVRDRGTGMTPDVRKRAEEPFFTTKGERGMGLGLFLARSVTEELGGRLEIVTEEGRGTEVSLILPLLAEEALARS